ncbi:hypothetical protein [Streptomyces yaizuensis]|uniref:Uncharacterized protein n=1 Tax=Streptomyces yaizuensis TaxID=2989713 RepID=A0AA86JBV8_9ACTN|nr:hypothetical protein [Streptomyces sp. YSPA8]BDT39678.1 hypothetical protein SYYSPA8_37800 [Streptomyces sp. YSPA8]
MTELTMTDRADRARIALDAYTAEAPANLFSFHLHDERVRLGVVAVEAVARATRRDPATLSQETADELLGDLIAYVFCLADGRIRPPELTRAAEQFRTSRPIRLDAALAADEAGMGRVAAMLGAIIDVAHEYDCAVTWMVEDAEEFLEEQRAAEAAGA